ncbi:aminotransferase class III-fold pyridoxal phosphate-dependent enzyme [Pseudomonas putida CSV86]|uniref:Aminotransferase class III-fold pyridoxal phosphate-dependent enzyme n=1 Tax=Pseudomonas bharatica CSV86 TaxID=1005395 RepID=L1LSM3_9PSED|nr:aminotransferase [Pseudomonas bharatica]NNJ15084.1 aminotransferase class III-fold pyridoxal phosphate-dependent enzyme [Pseudomonas bharatica CSV86]
MTARGSALAQRDIAYHLHPQTNLRLHEEVGPLLMERGEGIHVFDEQGQRYIEGMSGLWCATLGFSQPRLVEAAYQQLLKLPYQQTFAHRSHGPAADLAALLIEHAPVGLTKAVFQSSGSEAVDTAIKFVRYYHTAIGKPGKTRLIARQRSYHGTTLAAASLTGLPNMHKGWGEQLADVIHVRCPHLYRQGLPGESEEAFATRLAEELEQTILDAGPDTIGAFFAEPVMGTGGVILPPAGYFAKVQAVLSKYDILMVADEVICGFGRTGHYWGCDAMGIEPDMLTCAKGLSAAFQPISALLVSERIYQVIADQSQALGGLGHGYTYGGHPVAAAVALETLKIYDELDIVAHVRDVAPAFQAGIRALADHPLVGEARGIGLMAALEFVADKDSRMPFPAELKIAQQVSNALQRNGILLRALGDTLVMAPPLIIDAQQIATILNALTQALDDVLAGIRP